MNFQKEYENKTWEIVHDVDYNNGLIIIERK